MFHLITVPLFGARIQGPDLVLRHRHRARILAWTQDFLKGCVHISAQQESYSGTVLGNQV